MSKILWSLKLKVLVLAVLIGLTIHFSFQLETTATAACAKCVFPNEGGICVACQTWGAPLDTAYKNCVAIQETCSCNVSGGTCTLPKKPSDGGWEDDPILLDQ